MDQTPDQIASHIQAERDLLGEDIRELQAKVKGSVDWRVQVWHKPMAMLGLALAAGGLLATIAPKHRS